MELLTQIRQLLGEDTEIITGKKLEPLTTGFRGKKGSALMAVSPKSLRELYQLIELCGKLKTGYLLQGANTSLKGQSSPNGEEKPVIIIRTHRLNKMKILGFPDTNNYKILLAEPGLSLKEAEVELNKLGFDLPHKIGSHDFGNTFGASCANGCGGLRVDNRDGRASLTETGNMGVISIGANGIIYNGIVKPERIESGKQLFSLLDKNELTENDIIFPKKDEIDQFIKQLFTPKSYPIRNHRGDIIFSGDGGEGSQAIAYQMYLVRKKPQNVQTDVLFFLEKGLKEKFYKEVIFSVGSEKLNELPILCESMDANLVQEIVKRGTGYAGAFLFTLLPKFAKRHSKTIYALRNRAIKYIPFYLNVECFLGRILSYFFTPKMIRKTSFHELVILQFANRQFQTRLDQFMKEHREKVQLLTIKKGSFQERLIIQIRTISAVAILARAVMEGGTLLPFDDAMMPGAMVEKYVDLFYAELLKNFPNRVLAPYVFGHDLKQINHNEWIIKKKLSPSQILEVEKLQHEIIEKVGGIPHAEHGFGDLADLSLNRDELVKLVAHRLVNDPEGLANPGGGPERAYQKALADETIVNDGKRLAEQVTARELARKTLLKWD